MAGHFSQVVQHVRWPHVKRRGEWTRGRRDGAAQKLMVGDTISSFGGILQSRASYIYSRTSFATPPPPYLMEELQLAREVLGLRRRATTLGGSVDLRCFKSVNGVPAIFLL